MGTPYVSQPSFSNLQKQQDELLVLQSIFGSENIRSLNSNSQQYEVSIEFDRLPTPFFLKHRTTTPVTFLPPIILTIQLHDQYPSDYSSTFLLTSFYMSKRQLQELCEKMDSLFIQNEVIVYQWIELIKDEVCGKSEFVLDEEDMDGEGYDDPRALSTYTPSQINEVYQQLLDYNRRRLHIEFQSTLHQCVICTQEIPGSQFLRFLKCQHYFCFQCLLDYTVLHINSGSVEELTCPDHSCQLPLLPTEIKQILKKSNNEELYDKYERLTLQKSLEHMTDIVWCPRCQQPVLTSDKATDKLSMCSACHYSFCKKCKETYHSETPCPQEIEAIRLKRQHENLQKQLVAIGFTPKDHEYLLKEILAYETIELNTRQCPNCRVKIEKNGGCSHMFCQRCRTSFTWEQALVPVQNTATTLLVKELGDDVDKILKHLKDSAAGETENLELLTLIENAVYTRTKPCPYEGCNQLNVMSSNSNNWIICISCRQSFCFRCGREFVSPVQHFAAKSKCKQYVQLKRVMD